jgi:hypothetical protein
MMTRRRCVGGEGLGMGLKAIFLYMGRTGNQIVCSFLVVLYVGHGAVVLLYACWWFRIETLRRFHGGVNQVSIVFPSLVGVGVSRPGGSRSRKGVTWRGSGSGATLRCIWFASDDEKPRKKGTSVRTGDCIISKTGRSRRRMFRKDESRWCTCPAARSVRESWRPACWGFFFFFLTLQRPPRRACITQCMYGLSQARRCWSAAMRTDL